MKSGKTNKAIEVPSQAIKMGRFLPKVSIIGPIRKSCVITKICTVEATAPTCFPILVLSKLKYFGSSRIEMEKARRPRTNDTVNTTTRIPTKLRGLTPGLSAIPMNLALAPNFGGELGTVTGIIV